LIYLYSAFSIQFKWRSCTAETVT